MIVPLSPFATKYFTGLTRQRGSFLLSEFIEVQRESFYSFLKKGIAEEFSRINPIWEDANGLGVLLYPDRYLLIRPAYTIKESIEKEKTYGCQLYLPATLILRGESSAHLNILGEGGEGEVRGQAKDKENSISNGRDQLVAPFLRGSERPFKQLISKDSLKEGVQSRGVEEIEVERKVKGKRSSPLPLKGGYSRSSLRGKKRGWGSSAKEGREKSSSFQGVSGIPPHPTTSYMLRDGSMILIKGVYWVSVATLPLMTRRGHFIINGVTRVLINQITRSPGVYFHERIEEVDDKEKRSLYVDFICRRGAWLRIQTDKKDEIWAHLKRIRKIPLIILANALTACERPSFRQSKSDREKLALLHSELISRSRDEKAEGSAEKGEKFLWQKFRNPRSYDLGKVGRQRINSKLALSTKSLQLTGADLSSVAHYLKGLQEDYLPIDDIDHLQNRRIRASGEVLQGQFETGLYRLEKMVAFNLSKRLTKPFTLTSLTPTDLFSTRPLNGALRELFGSSPLSQYMDQTNPLSEVTQKRRFSSLGPGGVSRDTAGMQVRGIHPTHYSRICPIETPEGKNAGLVSSPTLFARVNQQGLVESPCYPIAFGQIQKGEGVLFLSAEREAESGLAMAPADLQVSRSNLLQETRLPVRVVERYQEGFQQTKREKVECVPILPTQILSVATALIPFLEHNDANRALMGSNMQRQAVPIIQPERPLVGTGLEASLVGESGHIVQSEKNGYVSYVSGEKVTISSPSTTSKILSCNHLSALKAKVNDLPYWTRFISPFPFRKIKKKGAPLSRIGVANLSNLKSLISSETLTIWQKKPRQWLVKNLSTSPFLLLKEKTSIQEQNDRVKQGKLPYDPDQSCFFVGKGWQERRRFLGGKKGFTHLVNLQVDLPFSEDQRTKASSFEMSPEMALISSILKGALWQPLVNGLPPTWRGYQGKNNKARGKERGKERKVHPLFFFRETSLKGGNQKLLLSPTTYPLQQYGGSNQRTCIVHRPSVSEGEWVQKGDLLADCASSDRGELALGKNLTVAYLPWEGFNFEDAVVINERLVKQDVLTSVHIQRYEVEVKETEHGSEKITNNIPSLLPTSIKGLDKNGLVSCGRWVGRGDVLIGKVTPLAPLVLTPHERLAYDLAGLTVPKYRDTSLRVGDNSEGRVLRSEIIDFLPPFSPFPSFKGRGGKEGILFPLSLPAKKSKKRDSHFLTNGDHPLVLRARVYVATKRKIRVGDKLSGRHGNKGIISTILPREDMPYLPNGKAVDMVLNPLGVPSRMNVGQVIESLLGLAASHLGQKFKITPFDEMYGPEASRSLVYLKLYQARLKSGYHWLFNPSLPGKIRLLDGRTGLPFAQSITVGEAYILKLIHMVNDKIHSRATGPYSVVTRQPLGGKANRGGQRVGEMEVWALEGFGAAYNLQEMLTSKSDDVVGRLEVLPSILKRKRSSLGTPEAFRVMARELQALCIDLGVYTVRESSLTRQKKDVTALT